MNTISPSILNHQAVPRQEAIRAEQPDGGADGGDERLVEEFRALLGAVRRGGALAQDDLAALEAALSQAAFMPRRVEVVLKGEGAHQPKGEGAQASSDMSRPALPQAVDNQGRGQEPPTAEEGQLEAQSQGGAPQTGQSKMVQLPGAQVLAWSEGVEPDAVNPLLPGDQVTAETVGEFKSQVGPVVPEAVVSVREGAGGDVAPIAATVAGITPAIASGSRPEAELAPQVLPEMIPLLQEGVADRPPTLAEVPLSRGDVRGDGKLNRVFSELPGAAQPLAAQTPTEAPVTASAVPMPQPGEGRAVREVSVALQSLESSPSSAPPVASRAVPAAPHFADGLAHGLAATARPAGAVLQGMLLRQAFEQARGVRGLERAGAPVATLPQPSAGQPNPAAPGVERRAASDAQPKPPRPLNRGEVTRMIQRVEVVMKEAARARDGKTISFRVEPYNLGEVKVDVSLRDGALHARLKAENTQVATALRDRAHELQGALRKLGLEVDVVTVTVLNEEPDSGLAADSGGSNSGKNFQGDGHNLPSSNGQPIENTVGNKIAETLVPTAQPLADVILDHWVA